MGSFGAEAIEEQTVECLLCDDLALINTRLTALGQTTYFEATQPGKTNGPVFVKANDHWYCKDCNSERRARLHEIQTRPVRTVPEPPNEWRFCQSCGEQIDPNRLSGQFCVECSD